MDDDNNLIQMQEAYEKLRKAEELKTRMIFNNPLKDLEINEKTNSYYPSSKNILLVLEYDLEIQGRFLFDEFSQQILVFENLPWRAKNDLSNWKDTDDAGLRVFIERKYRGMRRDKYIEDAFKVFIDKNSFHQVQSYVTPLIWDRTPRLETLFITHLGAIDSPYVRTVTRKTFVAAIKRIFEAGCKFDHMLVLYGPQGIMKSRILQKMGKLWFSDSLRNFSGGKDSFELLQGNWILEVSELSAMKKSDVNEIKNFISKPSDQYRPPYARRVQTFPRQSILIGTTNEVEILTDKTGNRRFWIVDCGMQEPTKSVEHDLTDYEIDQIWAEAKYYYEAGEKLYLDTPEMEKAAKLVQMQHSEDNTKHGMILEYLEKLLPLDWKDWDIGNRRNYYHDRNCYPLNSKIDMGERVKRDKVCAAEIWVELFEGDRADLNPFKSKEINDILRSMEGWAEYDGSEDGKVRFGKHYGKQRAFVRK